jgi:hypothetical protein
MSTINTCDIGRMQARHNAWMRKKENGFLSDGEGVFSGGGGYKSTENIDNNKPAGDYFYAVKKQSNYQLYYYCRTLACIPNHKY